MAEFFVEIYVEEIPSRMQKSGIQQFANLVKERFDSLKIEFDSLHFFVTPKRFILYVPNLATKTKSFVEEVKGPKISAPDQALQGFLKSKNLNKNDLVIKETAKGPVYYFEQKHEAIDVKSLLPEIINESLIQIHWPKSMKWSEGSLRFARPILGIMVRFNDEFLDASLDAGYGEKIPYRNFTIGHASVSPEKISPLSFDSYKQILKSAFVMIDEGERKNTILKQASEIAQQEGVVFDLDEKLLNEVAGLVEWPKVLLGEFDKPYLSLPPEILITSMKTHQKYFPLFTEDHEVCEKFLVVSNLPHSEQKEVIHGNERVIKARFSDAQFFWDQDLKSPLEDGISQLKEITYHEKIGTLYGKVERLEEIATLLGGVLNFENSAKLKQAAHLVKSDLVTHAVYEFPELQGTMGKYYALKQGVDSNIAQAIEQHYRPLGPGDECPTQDISIIMALADKIETLVAFFGIGLKPTGSKDPFALRRSALGIIRIIIENKLDLSIADVIKNAANLNYSDHFEEQNVVVELVKFIHDRFKVYLKDQGFAYDLIAALFNRTAKDNENLLTVYNELEALKAFRATDDANDLILAYKRTNNILASSLKNEKIEDQIINHDLLKETPEKELFQNIELTRTKISAHLLSKNFDEALTQLKTLSKPIDDFFESVIVNDENTNVRRNRLSLLLMLKNTFDICAKFSEIE